MKNKFSRKQRLKLFLTYVIAFALIFLALGSIILQVLRVSTYQEVDQELLDASRNRPGINRMIDLYTIYSTLGQQPAKQHNGEGDRIQQATVILWSAEGEVLNKDSLGYDYISIYSRFKLDKENLNKIQHIAVTFGPAKRLVYPFHSITMIAPEDRTNQEVAYVQLVVSTGQLEDTVYKSQKIVILCMIIFWLLSIVISYYLAKLTMIPILRSWDKQQKFVDSASHELRTPLTVIQNKLEHLFTKPQNTILDESENIALALNETSRLSQLTNDLLLLARSDSNATVIHKETVELKQFLADVVVLYQELTEQQDKKFIFENLPEAETIEIDPQRIHQLIVILLDNALKYTEQEDSITLTSEIDHHDWVISVKDTGNGISDENKTRIFERFYREDDARNRETGGYGLGLSIASWIVESHKGKITVLDNEPTGAIFQVKIPFKKKNEKNKPE